MRTLTESRDRPVALITGASAGIGVIFAETLAARGYDLLLVARRKDRLQEVAQRLNEQHGIVAEALPADLTQSADLDRLRARIAETPRLEMLVNNAGFGTKPRFWEDDLDRQDAMAHLHMIAPLHLTHAALRVMVPAGRGAVINVASMAAFFSSPSNVMYCSTKCWLNSFTAGLDLELTGTGVRVLTLCPGFTYSEFHDVLGVDRNTIPKKWWLDPHFVVQQALRDLDRGRWISVPGLRYKITLALAKMLPRPVIIYFARKRHTKLRQSNADKGLL